MIWKKGHCPVVLILLMDIFISSRYPYKNISGVQLDETERNFTKVTLNGLILRWKWWGGGEGRGEDIEMRKETYSSSASDSSDDTPAALWSFFYVII